MGKPKCTTEAIAEAVRLKRAGVNNRDIAMALGIHEATFYRWIGNPKTENQRKLSDALKKTEADYKSALLTIIYNSATKRDWKAAAWLLERKYPQEYAKQVRLPPQDLIETEDTDALYSEAGL